jgi:tetratricopeptide (TPR) repeat protein
MRDKLMQDTFSEQFHEEISTVEAAAKYHLTPSYVARLARIHIVHARKFGRDWIIDEATLREYLAQPRKTGPKPGRKRPGETHEMPVLGNPEREKHDTAAREQSRDRYLSKKKAGLHAAVFDPGVTEKLDSAESIINLAWEAWFASRPSVVARSVNKLLPGLEKIVYSPCLPDQTLRAKEFAIRAHGLLGSVCLDALQNDTALFHYMQAHRFAEEIHDVDLATTYLCLVGDVLRRQNDQSEALSLMEDARDQAADASNTTRGHILQLLAYTYGETGQEAAFERTISEATDLLAFSGEGIDTVQKEFIPFEVYEIRGKVNRDLGKPMSAIPYLELAQKSLATADSVTPRWQALLEISRAQTYCDTGDIAEGIELACKGFITAYQCRSPHQMNRVRKLLRKLEKGPFQNHSRVQDLKNLLSETYMHMDRVLDNDTMKLHRI